MHVVHELEDLALVNRRHATYKRYGPGVKSRKLGIAKGLEMAAYKLRGFVNPSMPIVDADELDRINES